MAVTAAAPSDGSAQPGRWALALRRSGRRNIYLDLLRATEGNAGVWRVIGTDGVWMLVAYIKAQAVPTVVPTTSWLPGGNAAPAPPAAGAPAAAAPAAPPAEASVSPDQMPAKYGCTACHAVDHKVVGPSFKGLYGSQVKLTNGKTVAASPAYLTQSIEDPDALIVQGYQPGIMSGVIKPHQVSQSDATDLIAYIKSLK